jgi:uncharacterized protein YjbI with pentapeptide repeats
MEQPTDQTSAPRWGEFPPPTRQAELEQRLQAWEQETDHRDRPSPFGSGDKWEKGFPLTGADVYWLAKRVAGDRDTPAARRFNLHLEGADLEKANLDGAALNDAYLNGVDLSHAQLKGAHLTNALLKGANLDGAQLEKAWLIQAHLEGAHLEGANLKKANLLHAHLEGANLREANLEGADLRVAHLEGADLRFAQLEGADLRGVSLDVTTQLKDVYLDAAILVADTIWNGVQLMGVEWAPVSSLGDEVQARQATKKDFLELLRAFPNFRQQVRIMQVRK